MCIVVFDDWKGYILKKQRIILALFAVLVLLISSAAFIIASLSEYDECMNYEKERIGEFFEDAAASGTKQLEFTLRQLVSEARNTAYILSEGDMGEERVSACFTHQFELGTARAGLIINSDGSLKYGRHEYEKLFAAVGKITLEEKRPCISDVVLSADGEACFAVSVPMTDADSKANALMLIYPASLLSEAVERELLGGAAKALLIHANGKAVVPGTPLPDWDFEKLKPEELTAAALGLNRAGEHVFSEAKYLLSKELSINDWTIICAIGESSLKRQASSFAKVNRGADIAVLAVIVIFTLASVFYISSRQRKLLFAKRRFKVAVGRSTRAVFQYDLSRDRFTILSQYYNINLPEDKKYLTMTGFLKLVHPADRKVFQTTFASIGKSGNASATIRISQLCGSGDYRWYHIDASRLASVGRGSDFVLGSIEDIDESEKERLILRIKATTDPLTGLYDRAETQRIVNERLMKLDANEFSTFCIIDIDNFKCINDRYGHECGDRALLFFAERLKATFRFEDVLGRLGGDEFVVYMALTSDKEVINRRFAELTESLRSGSKELGLPEISCSLGYITAKQGDCFQSVYKRADEEMYKAKTAGKRQAVGE